jgi:nucleosome binding factor SPN SPT16 subunit
VVQEIKVLRSSVSQREKERAERATLVQQERLVKAKVSSMEHTHATPIGLDAQGITVEIGD